MSVYIRCDRPLAPPLILRVAGIVGDVGFNQHGRLTIVAPHHAVFSVINSVESILVIPAIAGLFINTKTELKLGERYEIKPEDSICYKAVRWTIYRAESKPDSQTFAQTSVLGYKQRYPLHTGTSYSCGAEGYADIPVPGWHSGRSICHIKHSKNCVEIMPLMPLHLETGEKLQGTTSLRSPCKVEIEESNVGFSINF